MSQKVIIYSVYIQLIGWKDVHLACYTKLQVENYLVLFCHLFISGLMNAADYYGLDELKFACTGFIQARILFFFINKVLIPSCVLTGS